MGREEEEGEEGGEGQEVGEGGEGGRVDLSLGGGQGKERRPPVVVRIFTKEYLFAIFLGLLIPSTSSLGSTFNSSFNSILPRNLGCLQFSHHRNLVIP